MALATRCPNCSALFRVGAEQLKLRAGMVRCGSCRQVFNAIGCLDYVDPGHPAGTDPPPAEGRGAPPPLPEFPSQPVARALPVPSPPRRRHAAGATAPSVAGQDGPGDSAAAPAPTPSLTPDTGHGSVAAEPADAQTTAQLQALAQDAAAALPDLDAPTLMDMEPAFLRAPAPRGTPLGSTAWALLGLALFLIAAIQLALVFRSDVIVRLPQLRPALAALCETLACTVQWPMRPEFLAVVSSELQAVPGTDAMELDVVIRNRATFPMALPAVELTLTDSMNRAVARRVFGAHELLPAQTDAPPFAGDSLAPGADLSLRLLFDAPGLGAVGFVTYPFYP
jgi:predicted Zn finger-like uncharacterized protein